MLETCGNIKVLHCRYKKSYTVTDMEMQLMLKVLVATFVVSITVLIIARVILVCHISCLFVVGAQHRICKVFQLTWVEKADMIFTLDWSLSAMDHVCIF